MNTCVPIQNGSAGSVNPGSAGNANPGSAGSVNPGAGGSAGVTGNPNGGTGNVISVAGAGGSTSAGAGPTGSAGAAGSGPTVSGGPGYWTSKAWHGCSWTGVGTDGTSTITPKDFTMKPAADAYCVSGTVGAEPAYKSVALLGFNVNEPADASCVYKPVDTTSMGPPSVVPTADGIALDFVKKGTNTGFKLRVQIQGPNGAMAGDAGAKDRWCANITEVNGKVFVPWSGFTPSCWATSAAEKGTPYAKQPISAVVFTVPGELTDTPFNFCVNGFAYGSSIADAPNGPEIPSEQSGTIGGTDATGSTDPDFKRVKISAGGQNYIIQNNNWGNPSGSNQTLSYKGNSFKITETTGTGQSAPASFPSIYIGNNGNTANGVFSTKPGDNLPLQISAIKSINSTFRYSPAISGAINATYDIWFAKTAPATEYKDGIDGFVMIWTHFPNGKMPISMSGSKVATKSIASMDWDVYVGPRGPSPSGGTSQAPVVSFVNPNRGDSAAANDRAQSFKNVDIKKFIEAASEYGITSNMYLTDVFAGFEIWDGGSSRNLSLDEFSCVVSK